MATFYEGELGYYEKKDHYELYYERQKKISKDLEKQNELLKKEISQLKKEINRNISKEVRY